MDFEYVFLAPGWTCEVPMRCVHCRKEWMSLLQIDGSAVRLKPTKLGRDPRPSKSEFN
jgi:hypothetical protein